jgi:hypothetical protein
MGKVFLSLNCLKVKYYDEISQECHKLMTLKCGCVTSQRFSCSEMVLLCTLQIEGRTRRERERCGVCAMGVEGRSGPAREQEEGSGVQWDMSSEGEKE